MGVDASGKDDGDGTGIFFFVAMYNLQNFPDFVIVAAPCCFFHGFGGVAEMASGCRTFDDNEIRNAVIVIVPKLQKNLGGIKDMKRIPDAIFVVDPKKEKICVQEAHSLGITLIGIADTNCDPEELDYVIPGNDDAIRAVKLIVSKMADAVIEANQGEEMVAEDAAEEATEE